VFLTVDDGEEVECVAVHRGGVLGEGLDFNGEGVLVLVVDDGCGDAPLWGGAAGKGQGDREDECLEQTRVECVSHVSMVQENTSRRWVMDNNLQLPVAVYKTYIV